VSRAAFTAAAVAGALTLALALPAAPAARARRTCAKRSADPRAPRLTAPCAGVRIRAGHNFTFRVRDRDPFARQPLYRPYLNLTRRRPRHGILPSDDGGFGIFVQMTPVAGRPGHFSYRAPRYHMSGYWLFSRGAWYVQALQVDPTSRGAIRYGPAERITIH
jgi:hypothetical protein